MALKAVVASLDEVPEAYRSLYVQKNGKYVLDAEGVEDVTGLKSALEKERLSKGEVEKSLKDIKAHLGDADPAKAALAMKQLAELEAKAELGEIPETLRPKVEKLVDVRTERMRTEHDNQLKAYAKQLEDEKTKRVAVEGELKRTKIDSALKTLAIDKKVRKDLVDAAILKFTVGGVDGVTWDIDETGKVVAKKDGQIKYGKDASTPMTFDEGFELLLSKHPSFFEPSTGSGAANTGTGVTAFRINAADAKDPQKYQAASAAAEKAGQQLQIVE